MKELKEYLQQQVNYDDIAKIKHNDESEESYWKRQFSNYANGDKSEVKFIAAYYLKKQSVSQGAVGSVLSDNLLDNSSYEIVNELGKYGKHFTQNDIKDTIETYITTSKNTVEDWNNNIVPIISKMKNVKWVSDILSKNKNLI